MIYDITGIGGTQPTHMFAKLPCILNYICLMNWLHTARYGLDRSIFQVAKHSSFRIGIFQNLTCKNVKLSGDPCCNSIFSSLDWSYPMKWSQVNRLQTNAKQTKKITNVCLTLKSFNFPLNQSHDS